MGFWFGLPASWTAPWGLGFRVNSPASRKSFLAVQGLGFGVSAGLQDSELWGVGGSNRVITIYLRTYPTLKPHLQISSPEPPSRPQPYKNPKPFFRVLGLRGYGYPEAGALNYEPRLWLNVPKTLIAASEMLLLHVLGPLPPPNCRALNLKLGIAFGQF